MAGAQRGDFGVLRVAWEAMMVGRIGGDNEGYVSSAARISKGAKGGRVGNVLP